MKKKNRLRKEVTITGIILILVLGLGIFYLSLPIIDIDDSVKIEINSKLDPYSFIHNYTKCDKKDVKADASKVDTQKLGKYTLQYTVKDKIYNLEVEVQDTVAPEFEVLQKNFYVGNEVKAEQIVSNIVDNTTTTVTFKEQYDFSKVGTYETVIVVTDEAGNTTEKKATIKIIEPSNEKIVYLTFDDGPSKNTQKILDILDKYNAKATFFVTGENGGSQNYRNLIKEAHDRGHTIALHTYTHDFAIYKSVDSYFEDLNKVGNMVKDIIGYFPRYIRFPGGSSNTISRKYCKGIMSTLVDEVHARGFEYYDWNVGSGDASGNNVAESKIIKNSTGYSMKEINILMHDTAAKGTTVAALDDIIEHYAAKGYVFKGIDDNSYAPHHGTNN